MASTGWQQPLLHSQYILSSSPVAPNVLSPRKWSPTRQPNPNRVTKRPINECTSGAVDRSGGALSPFGGISRHRDAERQCRAVDRSYRILGIQQPVLSVETLTSTCWDTLKDISRAVNRSEGLISPFGGISTHRNHVERSTTRIVSQACSNQF